MESLDWKSYTKQGQVKATEVEGGLIELTMGDLKWKTSPRTLTLCYEAGAEEGTYVPVVRPVIAAQTEAGASFPSLGGKTHKAPPGYFLLAWGSAYDNQQDMWSLSPDLFALRYALVKEGGEAAGSQEVISAKEAPKEANDASSATAELRFGMASLQGKRPENEDAHIALINWQEGVSLFGVFDGHGGSECSAYCAKKLPKKLEWDAADAETALETAFVELDKKYIDKCNGDGSTAVLAVVQGDKVWVANCGDSRALLVRKGVCIPLSRDHKPDDPVERKRIENFGYAAKSDTIVQHGKRIKVARVDGQLAVSRAIGDDSWKDLDEEPATWAVTSVPEIRSEDIQPGDVCVLACDGLFDVISSDQVATWVSEQDLSQDLNGLAEKLASSALEKGSDDNVSVVLVTL